MATYLIGDVQGCYLTLKKLLGTIAFDGAHDSIIFLGDLINRGPRSLETLRLVKSNPSMNMVLGNHEIFAISIGMKAIKNPRPHTLDEVFKAPDAMELIDWLRSRPLMIRKGSDIFVHAGILPAVSIFEAEQKAEELTQIIGGEKAAKFLKRYYENTPKILEPDMRPKKSLRLALSYLTLIRMCVGKGVMDNYNGSPKKAQKNLTPWFMLRDDPESVYFGHWAALGVYQHKNYYCLDSGCVWNGKLSALRLEDQRLFQVDHCD